MQNNISFFSLQILYLKRIKWNNTSTLHLLLPRIHKLHRVTVDFFLHIWKVEFLIAVMNLLARVMCVKNQLPNERSDGFFGSEIKHFHSAILWTWHKPVWFIQTEANFVHSSLMLIEYMILFWSRWSIQVPNHNSTVCSSRGQNMI